MNIGIEILTSKNSTIVSQTYNSVVLSLPFALKEMNNNVEEKNPIIFHMGIDFNCYLGNKSLALKVITRITI